MIISSRTPEGRPHRCPACGTSVRLEPSERPGDATCPQCGGLVWFAEVTVVEFGDGLIDREFYEQLAQLAEAGRLEVLLDFSNLRFFSSAVLDALIRINKLVRSTAGHLAVCGLSPELTEVFKITRLDNLFKIYRDQAEAMRSWFDD